MVYMMIQHGVNDFDAWKAVFDSKADLRQSAGELSAQILHDMADPNKLTLLFGWDSLENAQAYASNPALKAAMQNAGVSSPPSFQFLVD